MTTLATDFGGRGPVEELWEVGDNEAVDAAVICGGQLLLVLRNDGGGWALPGGFKDAGESDVQAMLRELSEETGVDAAQVTPTLFERVLVDDPRNTADRWVTTRVGVFLVKTRPAAKAADDAADVRWVALDEPARVDAALRVETGVGLYRAHPPLIQAVYEHGR